MNKGDDIITTFIGGCVLLSTLGITMVLLFSWIFS
jgi:hypothetical protein